MKKWEDFLVSKIILHKFLYKNQHPAYRLENIHSERRETREKVRLQKNFHYWQILFNNDWAEKER